MRLALAVAALTGLYALALGSVEPRDLLTGAVVSLAALAFAGQLRGDPQSTSSPLIRLLAAVPWAVVVTREVLAGAIVVARIVIWPRSAPPAGIVAIPIGERSEQGVAVTGLVTTISPGEVMLGVDWEREVILVHVIDAGDPDQVRDRHQYLYERYQRRVFP